MRKVASLVMTALIITSFSGCTNRNTSMRNQNRPINQGTTQGTRTGYVVPNGQIKTGMYRDGVYVGQGDKNAAGRNQTATVVVTGGRMTDITLKTIDSQGREISTSNISNPNNANISSNVVTDKNTAPQGTGGNSNMINSNPGTAAGYNYSNQGARTYGTPGATTGGMAGGMASGNYGRNTSGNTGYATGDYGFQNVGGNAGPMIGGIPDGTSIRNNNVNTGTTTGISAYDKARTDLASAMLKKQSYDVSIANYNTSEVNNWKLAVRRALDKAK